MVHLRRTARAMGLGLYTPEGLASEFAERALRAAAQRSLTVCTTMAKARACAAPEATTASSASRNPSTEGPG